MPGGAHCGENTVAGEAVLAAQSARDGQRSDRCGDKEDDGGHQGVHNSVPSVRARNKPGRVGHAHSSHHERGPEETDRRRGYPPRRPVADHPAQGGGQRECHHAQGDEVGDHDPAERAQAQLTSNTGHPVITRRDQAKHHHHREEA